MTTAQIFQLAAAAGFSGADLATAVAIAQAESSGNPNAYNPEGSYGLWQIYLPAHPEFASWNLYDPQQNAAAAYQVYKAAGYSFAPWSTFKGGQYLAYLPTVNAAASASSDGNSTTLDIGSALASLDPATLVLLGVGALALVAALLE